MHSLVSHKAALIPSSTMPAFLKYLQLVPTFTSFYAWAMYLIAIELLTAMDTSDAV